MQAPIAPSPTAAPFIKKSDRENPFTKCIKDHIGFTSKGGFTAIIADILNNSTPFSKENEFFKEER